MDQFLDRVKAMTGQDFYTQIKKYRVDYLIQDQTVDRWPIDRSPFLEPVFRINEIIIYKFD